MRPNVQKMIDVFFQLEQIHQSKRSARCWTTAGGVMTKLIEGQKSVTRTHPTDVRWEASIENKFQPRQEVIYDHALSDSGAPLMPGVLAARDWKAIRQMASNESQILLLIKNNSSALCAVRRPNTQRNHHNLDTDHVDILSAQTTSVTTCVVAQLVIQLDGLLVQAQREKVQPYTSLHGGGAVGIRAVLTWRRQGCSNQED